MKAQKYIAGQVWWLDIDSHGTDGCEHKTYPYLIVAANNRRIIALRMTHGGERASNWPYEIGTDLDGRTQRIIADAPITISLNAVKYERYGYMVDKDDFENIILYHYAAMAYQAIPDIFSPENVAKINEIIATHEDSMFAFGKYLPDKVRNATTPETTNKEPAEANDDEFEQPVIMPDFRDAYNGADEKLADIRERLAYADADDAPYLAKEHAALLQKKREETAFDAYTERKASEAETEAVINALAVPRNGSKNVETVKLKDIIISNRGDMSLEELRIAAKACGITTTFKFEFNELMNDGTIRYASNRCNCMLKSDINRIPGSKYHRIPNEMYASVYADACRFGTHEAAKIWGVSNTTMRRICGLET